MSYAGNISNFIIGGIDEKTVEIRLIRTSAGSDISYSQNPDTYREGKKIEDVERIEIPSSMLKRKNEKDVIAFRLMGPSMENEYMDSAILLATDCTDDILRKIKSGNKNQIKSNKPFGNDYIIKIEGEGYCFKTIDLAENEGEIQLISYNPHPKFSTKIVRVDKIVQVWRPFSDIGSKFGTKN